MLWLVYGEAQTKLIYADQGAASPNQLVGYWEATQRIGNGQGLGLQPHRQQSGREPNPAMGTWTFQLVVRRIAAQW